MDNITLYGTGGHFNSVVDVILSTQKYKISNILDINTKKKISSKIKILHPDIFIKNLKKKTLIHISFASIYDLSKRALIFDILKSKDLLFFPKIISKNSYFSKSSNLDEGSIIMHGVNVNSNVCIGKNVVINSNALIEHDVIIGDNSHISTGVIINGSVKIGKNCFIGSGSVVKENILIPDNSFIKMGSIIKK